MEENRAVSRSTKLALRQFTENVLLSIHKDYSLYQINIGFLFVFFPQVQAKLYVLIVTPTDNSPLTPNPGLLEADFQTINMGSPFHILISTDRLSLARLEALQALNQGKQRSLPYRTITYDPAGKRTSSLRAHCLVLVQI